MAFFGTSPKGQIRQGTNLRIWETYRIALQGMPLAQHQHQQCKRRTEHQLGI